jgi:type II secretory pathway component PulF
MDSHAPPTAARAELGDLIALTDEMAALVRAGVPLESGMARAARDLARRPSAVAETISQRMQSGATLTQALREHPHVFPESYIAVVEAGLAAGRLPAALEGLASTSRRAAELRRLTRASLIYPLLIALGAYVCFVLSMVWLQPLLTAASQDIARPVATPDHSLASIERSLSIWWFVIPLAVLVLVVVWWRRASRVSVDEGWLAGVSPIARMLHLGRISTFADILALLIENNIPLPQGIRLAADASGDRQLKPACDTLADELARGATAAHEKTSESKAALSQLGLPALLRLQLAGGGNRLTLADSLRMTAQAYRRRAVRMDDWLRLYLPLTFLIVIGGTSVLLYALSVLGPWYDIMQHIAGGARS